MSDLLARYTMVLVPRYKMLPVVEAERAREDEKRRERYRAILAHNAEAISRLAVEVALDQEKKSITLRSPRGWWGFEPYYLADDLFFEIVFDALRDAGYGDDVKTVEVTYAYHLTFYPTAEENARALNRRNTEHGEEE